MSANLLTGLCQGKINNLHSWSPGGGCFASYTRVRLAAAVGRYLKKGASNAPERLVLATDGLGTLATVQTRGVRGPNCWRCPKAVVSKVGGAGQISGSGKQLGSGSNLISLVRNAYPLAVFGHGRGCKGRSKPALY